MSHPSLGSLDVGARVDQFLAAELPALSGAPRVMLTGDASDRRYLRLQPSTGAPVVLALHAEPFEFATLPFAVVGALLEQIPLPVPRVLAHSDALGVLALEDLGDVTLQASLGAASAADRQARYDEAVALIVRLQRRGAELANPSVPPYTIRFDVEKLTWELNFFVRHFLEGYRGVTLPPADRQALDEEWRSLAGTLAGEPAVVCHRDYHSRNLMVHDGRLYVIDFQDARMGPDTYDLVSLLRDSYVDIESDELERLLARFLERKGPSADSPERFRRRFGAMAVQRNLKALGTFGYQTVARGNPVYLQYVPRTLRYAREALHRDPRFGRLRGVLARHVEELA
jgi:N-acetylmuramate 1-kinase